MHRLLPEIQCFRLNGGGGASTLLACTPHPGPLPGAENDTPRLGITGPCRVPPTVILGGGGGYQLLFKKPSPEHGYQ